MTDWHLQAFGEWLAYLFPREPERLWEHCVWQGEWTQCGSLCSLLNVNVLLVLLLFFFQVCSDVFRILLDPIVGIWCIYTDFRRVEISDQLAREPLCDNLVQSTGCIVILLIFGSILHELSCTEPVLGSPLRLSTLYSSCSMWELGKAKCTPITGG